MVHETPIRVRFGETDLLGHVNNVSFFSYLEHARVQFFKELTRQLDHKTWRYILASIKCDFLAQVYFDQSLRVVTKVSRIGNKSFDLEQPIVDSETGNLVAKGHSTIVYFDFKEQKSQPIPEHIREALVQYVE
ncbi:MAG: acyl-CoA thioesterase [Novibacillus thermophilus]